MRSGMMGHGDGKGMSMDFSRLDTNNDGVISRAEWDAMHGGSGGASSGASQPPASGTSDSSSRPPAR